MYDSEVDIVNKVVTEGRKLEVPLLLKMEDTIEFEELSIEALILRTQYSYRIEVQIGSRDRRIRMLGLSLGAQVLHLVGIRDSQNEKHPLALDPKEFKFIATFNNLFKKYRRGDINSSQKQALSDARNAIINYIKNNVIVIREIY